MDKTEEKVYNTMNETVCVLWQKYIDEMNYESYALNTGCGGNLEKYLKTRAKLKILKKILKHIQTILNEEYEY